MPTVTEEQVDSLLPSQKIRVFLISFITGMYLAIPSQREALKYFHSRLDGVDVAFLEGGFRP